MTRDRGGPRGGRGALHGDHDAAPHGDGDHRPRRGGDDGHDGLRDESRHDPRD